MNPFDWTAGPFLTLYVSLAVALFALGVWRRASFGGAIRGPARLNELEWAYLAGGPGRVCDVALLCLAAKESAVVMAKSHKIVVSDIAPLKALAGGAWAAPKGMEIGRRAFFKAVEPDVDEIKRRLQKLGLCPADEEMETFRFIALIAAAVLLAFGAAKATVGSSRHHPIGFLLVCMGATVVATIVLLRRQTRTRAGRAALETQRRVNARAARAPLSQELMLAVALSGAVVLSGTAYASIYEASRNGGGDGGGCSGGGGGGGCGGGGCGGCS